MLAQLDKDPAVEEARVDWTGKYFLLKLKPGANATSAVGRAKGSLGGGLKRLEPAAEAEQLGAFQRGEPWMKSGETLKMSQEEARVLSLRFAERAAGRAGLDEERTRRLRTLLNEELDATMRQLHESGKPPDMKNFRAQWGRWADSVIERSREFLSEEEASRVKEELLRGPGR